MASDYHADEEMFETSDLNLASFLRCRGFGIWRIRKEGGTRSIFLFRRDPALTVAVLEYANDCDIAVRSFSNTVRDLKALTRMKDMES